MQIIYWGNHVYFHNCFPFTIILASALGIIQIYLTAQVIRLRQRFKTAIGEIKKEIYIRRNGALANFNSFTPITLVLFALAENNRTNCGILFFIAGYYILARIVHIYSLYSHETKTKSYRLRTFSMVSTFAVILALAVINLYSIATNILY